MRCSCRDRGQPAHPVSHRSECSQLSHHVPRPSASSAIQHHSQQTEHALVTLGVKRLLVSSAVSSKYANTSSICSHGSGSKPNHQLCASNNSPLPCSLPAYACFLRFLLPSLRCSSSRILFFLTFSRAHSMHSGLYVSQGRLDSPGEVSGLFPLWHMRLPHCLLLCALA